MLTAVIFVNAIGTIHNAITDEILPEAVELVVSITNKVVVITSGYIASVSSTIKLGVDACA